MELTFSERKEKKGHIKNHALGLLVGRANVSLGTPSFLREELIPKEILFIIALYCECVFRSLTSIWCMSLHVDQIWLLV